MLSERTESLQQTELFPGISQNFMGRRDLTETIFCAVRREFFDHIPPLLRTSHRQGEISLPQAETPVEAVVRILTS
jgi:hypothetical protein